MGQVASVEETVRRERIIAYVNTFNERQACLYVGSLQWQMRALREEKQRLLCTGAQLLQVFIAHQNLQNETKAMIETPQLEVKESRQSVYIVKQAHYKRLKTLDLSMPRCIKQKEFEAINDALEHCQEAYNIKCDALIQLRKKAKDDIVGMFDVYLLLRELIPEASLTSHILCQYYMRLIFAGVVLTNRHIIEVAFETLKTRARYA